MAPVACYLSRDYSTSEESILTRQHVVATRERGSAQVKSSTGSRRRARAGTNPFQRRQDENAPQVRPSVRGASRGTRVYERGAVSTCRLHRLRAHRNRQQQQGRGPGVLQASRGRGQVAPGQRVRDLRRAAARRRPVQGQRRLQVPLQHHARLPRHRQQRLRGPRQQRRRQRPALRVAAELGRHHRDRQRHDEGRHPVAGQALLPAARRACDGLLLLE